MVSRRIVAFVVTLLALSRPMLGGPPYITDDPEPTDYKHFEIYLFNGGTASRSGTGIASGLDFNYGAALDLQLTAVVPVSFNDAGGGRTATDLGNIELAAKYRVLHQQGFGWDVAIFPRVFLPAGSRTVGERHAALLLPIWIGKNWGDWSTYGGGGCEINRGGTSQNFCLMGWALAREVLPGLQMGAELYHQGADTRGERATSGIGTSVIYDIGEHYHLMGSIGPGIQNAGETNRYSWYTALLFTF
ncbi:MAG: transporter [Alphaproteobacteria bacterium]|nr:transporter [Alphaproteobacteria bacterium]